MATIKYNEDEEGNKRIILKDGKVSCECCGPCKCSIISNPEPYGLAPWLFEHNTFTITKEEYNNFCLGKPLNVEVNIINSEYFKTYDFFGNVTYEGSLNFSAVKNFVINETYNEGVCYRQYLGLINISDGSMYLYYNGGADPAGVDLTVTGNVIFYLTIFLDSSSNEYRINYNFDLFYEYVASAIIDGNEYYWSESPTLSQLMHAYTTTNLWNPVGTLGTYTNTGFPNDVEIKINQTVIETPKTYEGPRAYREGYFPPRFGWASFSQPIPGGNVEYNNSSSVKINIYNNN